MVNKWICPECDYHNCSCRKRTCSKCGAERPERPEWNK